VDLGTRFWMDLLTGSNTTRLALDRGESIAAIVSGWEAGLRAFGETRKKHLLY
jgi:uncharacterized protein YbbC (DUF1343 family)